MNVLVVGDGETDLLGQRLRRSGYATVRAGTGEEALTRHRGADLVLLDLELTDMDGLEVCRIIRSHSDVPIITFTDRDDELHRVLSLQGGSDDCLIKPYGFRELVARIEAVMRRVHPRHRPAAPLTHGPLTADPRLRQVRVGDALVELTRKEFDLLYLLLSHPGTVLPRAQIMAKVWGHIWTPSSRSLDMHVSSLRKKLGDGSWIVTVRGVGFRLGCPPAAGNGLTDAARSDRQTCSMTITAVVSAANARKTCGTSPG
jgi:DNA-binding response OmpR family regulator